MTSRFLQCESTLPAADYDLLNHVADHQLLGAVQSGATRLTSVPIEKGVQFGARHARFVFKDVASSTSPSATTGEAISVDLNTIQTVPSCPEPLITQSWSHCLTTNGETAIYPRPGKPPIFPSLFIHRTTISSLLCKKSPILNTHAKIP